MNATTAPRQPRIENWRIEYHGGKPRLVGQAYGHPSADVFEGEFVITSEVQNIDFAAGTARTLNTTYQLGARAAT